MKAGAARAHHAVRMREEDPRSTSPTAPQGAAPVPGAPTRHAGSGPQSPVRRSGPAGTRPRHRPADPEVGAKADHPGMVHRRDAALQQERGNTSPAAPPGVVRLPKIPALHMESVHHDQARMNGPGGASPRHRLAGREMGAMADPPGMPHRSGAALPTAPGGPGGPRRGADTDHPGRPLKRKPRMGPCA